MSTIRYTLVIVNNGVEKKICSTTDAYRVHRMKNYLVKYCNHDSVIIKDEMA